MGQIGLSPKNLPIPTQLLLPRLRSTLKAIDVDCFFDSVGEILQLQLEVQGGEAPDGAVPFYVHSFPKERLARTGDPFDGITWGVLSSTMASMDNAGGRISRKPMEIEVKPDPNRSGYNSVTQIWLETSTVEFTIWSKSSDTRSKLLTWFHKVLMRYANVLQFFDGRGIYQFQFVGRGADTFETREQQEVHFGTLTYQFRVQYVDSYLEKQLTSLTATAQVESGDISSYQLPITQ
jgi:hypothetical protein